MFRRAAEFADKILKGAKPAEMPVEQPNTFDQSQDREGTRDDNSADAHCHHPQSYRISSRCPLLCLTRSQHALEQAAYCTTRKLLAGSQTGAFDPEHRADVAVAD